MSRRSTQRSRRSQYLRKSQRKGKSLRHQKRSVQYPLLRRSLRHRRYSGGDGELSGGDKESDFKKNIKNLLQTYYFSNKNKELINNNNNWEQQIDVIWSDIEKIIKTIWFFYHSIDDEIDDDKCREIVMDAAERIYNNNNKQTKETKYREPEENGEEEDLKFILTDILYNEYNQIKYTNISEDFACVEQIQDIINKIIIPMMFFGDYEVKWDYYDRMLSKIINIIFDLKKHKHPYSKSEQNGIMVMLGENR